MDLIPFLNFIIYNLLDFEHAVFRGLVMAVSPMLTLFRPLVLLLRILFLIGSVRFFHLNFCRFLK